MAGELPAMHGTWHIAGTCLKEAPGMGRRGYALLGPSKPVVAGLLRDGYVVPILQMRK